MTIECSAITGGTVTSLADAATITWPANQGYAYRVTLGGNRTLANPSDLVLGALYILEIIQDGTGGRTLSLGTAYKASHGAGITLSTNSGAKDILLWYADSETTLTQVSIILDATYALIAPTTLTATTNQVGQITLHWVDNSSNESYFRVEDFDGLDWGFVAYTNPNVTSYIWVGAAGAHTFRVKAIRGPQAESSYRSDPTNTAVGTAL